MEGDEMKILGRLVLVVAITGATANAAVAQTRYTTKTTGDIVQLRDNTADVTVSVMTSLGSAYEMVVKGHNIIQTSFTSTDQYRAAPGLRGMPLLAPWANRLDEMAFWANGRKYNLDPEIGNVRGPVPLHGFIQGGATWTLVETKADRNAAWVTSRLDFYRQPLYMAQWPSYWLTDSPRDEWTLSVGAKTHWLLAENKVPTGVTEPITNFFPDPKNVALKDYALDDVFSDLERDAEGRATMTVKGKQQQLEVKFGPKYKAAVLWSNRPGPPRGGGPGRGPGGGQGRAAGPGPAAPSGPPPPPPASLPLSAKPETVPPDRGYIAFEPMVGITNSMNMAQKGTYKELQMVPPKGTWEESFWIKATGF
jgi:aldose 1-epimerase